ncbi:adiponectin receptor protein [Venturia nashicola]|nr:adiponectin receptor protein [Venturia nashicola]
MPQTPRQSTQNAPIGQTPLSSESLQLRTDLPGRFVNHGSLLRIHPHGSLYGSPLWKPSMESFEMPYLATGISAPALDLLKMDLKHIRVPRSEEKEKSTRRKMSRRNRSRAKTLIYGLTRHLLTREQDHDEAHHALICYNDLDNDFVQTAYRKISNDCVRSFQSIFRIHNETFSLWSHGIGCIAFSSLLPLLMRRELPRCYDYGPGDARVFLFFCRHMLSLLNDTDQEIRFHGLENHSPLVWEIVSQLDHIGIVLGVFGATVPLAHFEFYCDHRIKIAYYLDFGNRGMHWLRPRDDHTCLS